jgi:hypothetical protein
VHRLDVVAVEVADEHRVVAGVVLREDPRRVEDLGARVEGRLVSTSSVLRALNAMWSSRVSLPPAGPIQKPGNPRRPAMPTAAESPTGWRVASVNPIGPKTRR